MAEGAKSPDRLYELLPAFHREQDIAQGEPLRALLRVIQDQADLVEGDIRRLWENFFIETCAPWVIPYIGDLVGATPLFDAGRTRQPDTAGQLFPDLLGPSLVPEVALRSRADVAKTIYYRRRKGTLPMLEELARDVTGWAAHAVEFFELLIWAQFVRNHLRMHSAAAPDLRSVEFVDRLEGPFDAISHTVDVRPICQLQGRHNIDNIGFFLWRLGSYEAENVAARPSQIAPGFGFHFSPLGNPAPLFSRLRREGDEAGLATEFHVPGPIRPAAFHDDLRRYQEYSAGERPGFSEFYGLFDTLHDPLANPSNLPQGSDSSLMIFRDGVAVPPHKVRCLNLSNWKQPNELGIVGVDPAQGRLAFSADWLPQESVDVFHHYGFSAGLGGGPYRRQAWLIRQREDVELYSVDPSGETAGAVATIQEALDQWATAFKPNAIIRVFTNRTFEESLQIEPAHGRWLAIEAADGFRPHLSLSGPLEISGDHPTSSITLSGLLIEGSVHISGSLERLRLLHTTLVPGCHLTEGGDAEGSLESLLVEPGSEEDPQNTRLGVEIAFSITGPLRIPDHAEGLWLLDSIVDGAGAAAVASPGGEAGPPGWVERVTIFGPSRFKAIPLASEVIFSEPVSALRRQEGCIRFSYVPPGSVTPQRYRCQPDLEIRTRIEAARKEQAPPAPLSDAERALIREGVEGWLVPSFTSRRYGQPAYAQLHLRCPLQIRTGAEDGSEMGAFSHLKQPQREANLRLRLKEYLPFGLEPGLIFVT